MPVRRNNTKICLRPSVFVSVIPSEELNTPSNSGEICSALRKFIIIALLILILNLIKQEIREDFYKKTQTNQKLILWVKHKISCTD